MNCVTLISDFGLQDASVASAKGILMQYLPQNNIVDITHEIETFLLQQAAYVTLAAYRNFPVGTCHVLLIDIFSEPAPYLLLFEKDGHYFLAPDNGLLALMFGKDVNPVWQVYQLPEKGFFADWMHVIGKIIAELRNGATPHTLNLPVCTLKNAPHSWQPLINHHEIECHVIHIDRYGNVVLNLTKEDFELHTNGRQFRITYARGAEINQLSSNYCNVPAPSMLCRFNSAGYLEIAVNKGSAASVFGLRITREKSVMYNTVKIYIE